MTISVVIALCNDGPATLPFLHSLIATTPDGTYEVVIVDRGSTDETAQLLNTLGGDVTVLRESADISLAAAINHAIAVCKSEIIAISSTQTRFIDRWWEAMATALMQAPFATPAAGSSLDVIMLNAAVVRACGGLNESLADSQIFADLVARMQAATSPEPASPVATELSLPSDLMGWRVGEALVQVIGAGINGAAIGELPVEAAERLRERLWMEEERRLLLEARAGRDVCWTDENEAEPLVTVRIATKDRCEELMEIALPSAMNQTYENLDILIVGDNTDDATVNAMKSVTDPRVRFFNLPSPSMYPRDQWGWWLVHGSPPMNLGIELAAGSWINPVDDDDEMTPDHVESLLSEARRRRLEFVWSQTLMETPDGWQILGAEPMGPGATTAGAIMWSSGLRFMKMSTTSWKINEPHDGNMWRRMYEIGVRMGFLPKITYRYYMGRNMKENLTAG